jgi:hypothetical protein
VPDCAPGWHSSRPSADAALAFELGQRIVQAKTDVGDAAGVFHVSNEQGKKTLLLQLFI